MRLITIEEYNDKTMQLARPIYDRHRRVLLAAGRTIHPKYLERLKQMDIKYLFVDDFISDGISMEELVDMPTWMDAVEVVQQAFEDAKVNKLLDIRAIQKLAFKLLDEVSKRKILIIIPSTSLASELQLYAHAVNVALLALQLGKKLMLNHLQMNDLAIGALLHDIGKAVKGEEHHTVKGFNYLRKNREISLLSAHVAYQHHEMFNGEGVPRQIHDQQIHQYAQICGIANRFENLLSKEGVPPHEAMEILMAKSDIDFSQQLVRLFINTIPSYPPGTTVTMSDGKEAIVTKIVDHMQRPHIRYLSTNEEVSLAERPNLLIVNISQEQSGSNG
ncbi:HD-GYP domain-containing protein [Anoxybacteroides tepidamans]|uniref:HD-GYP domain-containing protein n=1 Tax=Anoxybacteroides tepidamans TaxID=265948 RepID=UPI00048082C4|nr:HD domain-containing phosphohydrolase [Anoxybacillus tepidamans]